MLGRQVPGGALSRPEHVVAVDEGGNTGLAVWRAPDDFVAWAEPAGEALMTVHRMLATDPPDLLVVEKITITGNTLQKSRDVQLAIEMTGVLRYLASAYGVPFKLQTPSDAFSFTTDEKLRRLGWWTKGVDHPRAATKHLVLALAEAGAIDLRRLLAARDDQRG